ncbi:hypothetical protein AB6A40_010683 [Gnathostoma spinigerum]|uniref:Transcription factor CBF/NF-Y/archaeal histone domain-containing protein n=1 Tax=Gnathostoma spinigerum TaxID=75299 RepID=A0ABD6F211_9BILA
MQSDEEIGRMVASVPVAIGRAMEHFAEKLLEASAQCVQCSTSRTLSPFHMKQAMLRNRHFAFLEPLMRDITLPTRAGGELAWSTPMDSVPQSVFPFILPGAVPNSLPSCLPELLSQQTDQCFSSHLFNSNTQTLPLVPMIQPVSLGPKRRSSNGSSDPQNGVKPKRGRPRKFKKEEKCVDEILGGVTEVDVSASSDFAIPSQLKTNGGSLLSDSELMPPPALPLRHSLVLPTSSRSHGQNAFNSSQTIVHKASTVSKPQGVGSLFSEAPVRINSSSSLRSSVSSPPTPIAAATTVESTSSSSIESPSLISSVLTVSSPFGALPSVISSPPSSVPLQHSSSLEHSQPLLIGLSQHSVPSSESANTLAFSASSQSPEYVNVPRNMKPEPVLSSAGCSVGQSETNVTSVGEQPSSA